ncbi:MAG: hypothetical protein OXC82_12230 [Rhodobacteraceae bacterium]|nr:hypothetical protein [Paracoccaceae bacterium]
MEFPTDIPFAPAMEAVDTDDHLGDTVQFPGGPEHPGIRQLTGRLPYSRIFSPAWSRPCPTMWLPSPSLEWSR